MTAIFFSTPWRFSPSTTASEASATGNVEAGHGAHTPLQIVAPLLVAAPDR